MAAQEPENLRKLGERLDEAQKRNVRRDQGPPPTQMGIAFRFATELVAALLVGGALGWGLDWLFGFFGIHTRPLFIVVFFMLGAAAGIRNVMRAAKELNAEIAAHPAPSVKDDEETEPVAMNPMEQFTIKPIVPLHIGGYDVSFTNQSLLMVIVAVAASLFLTLAMSKRALVPSRAQSMAEMSYEFVANMIQASTGDDGLRFFPFVFTLFVFVLFSNFFGMIPGSFTVTSQIIVTFSLAALVILTVLVTGFAKHGIGFLKLFVPKAPLPLLFLLVPIEIISFLTRPISLSVRLFANMLAGHTMLAVFAGFVVLLGGAGGVLSVLSIAPMALIVAIMLLELLVAFLQAYVFAILTCIYLNEALHLHDHH